MKLSEALRLGEFALEPAHLEWIYSRHGKPCSGCAVGRACIAAGYEVKGNHETIFNLSPFFDQTWPWTKQYEVPREVAFFRELNHALQHISNLYEMERWSMRQIADWVATIEPEDAPTTIEQPQAAEAMK